MADPIVPLSTALRETEFTKLINTGRFIEPPPFKEVQQRLMDYNECVIVGSPRSGKTYLALYTAKTVHDEQYKGVLYLDFNRVKEPVLDFSEIATHHELSPGDLLIIDNWHGRLDCKDELLSLLNLPKWKIIRLLYLVTHFPADDGDLVLPAPPLRYSPPEVVLNPINTDDSLLDLAAKIINNTAVQKYGNRELVPGLIEEQEVKRILNVPSRHKKMRGNLRYLMWRLEAWNPNASRLEDVGAQEVMETIGHHLVGPAGQSNLAALRKVAAVAQWEVPYQCPDAPKEFHELQKKNLIYQLSSLFAWYMDSTDAYLFLEYQEGHGGKTWAEVTESLLKDYLEQSPDQVPVVLARIITQADKEIKLDLLIALLKSNKILEREKQFSLDGVKQGYLGVPYAMRWAGIIFRSLPKDKTEMQNRVSIMNALLPKELGEFLGARAQTSSLGPTLHLLRWLKKEPELSHPFVTSFLASFGEENLYKRLEEAKSGSVQRTILRRINFFDPDMSARLRKAVKLKPEPKSAPRAKRFLQNTFWWLTSGTLCWGDHRRQRIEYLKGFGEEELHDLVRLQHPLGWLQRILLDANWLAPEEANRIASMTPAMWPELNRKDVDSRTLSLLVTHLRYANPGAAADFVSLLLDGVDTFNTLLLQESSQSLVNSLGRMLVTIEHAAPGSAGRWCDIHVQSLLQVLTSFDDKSLHQVLGAMAMFAPDSLKKAFASQDVQQRLKHLQDDNQRWTRNGILAANGLSSLASPYSINGSKLGSFDAEYLTFVLYGMQNFLGMSSVVTTLKQLAAVIPLNPDVVGHLIQIGRYSPPWTAQQAIGNLKVEMSPSLDPRTLAFQYIVMAGPELTWDDQWLKKHTNYKATDVYRVPTNIRGLIAAGFERLLLLNTTQEDPIVHATVNSHHPLVYTAQQQIRTVLAPLTEQDLTIPQWDEALGGKMLLSEADRWRYRLLRAGKVRCDLGKQSERFEVRFALVRESSQDLIRQLVFGESDLA